MAVSLVALRAFEAAARHSSFKEAADELNLSATAISHQVRSLERSLGHRLFNRMVRKVTLTPEGEELSSALIPAFRSINAAVGRLQNRSGRHIVTLGAAPLFGSRWLAPRLGLFWQENPDIDLRLHHSPLPVEQQMASYDLAIAWGTNEWSEYEADLLLGLRVTPVYAPSAGFHLQENSEPGSVLEYPLLHFNDDSAWRLWLKAMDVDIPSDLYGMVFEDANVELQATLEGQGVSMGFLPLVEDEIAVGRLLQPWPESVAPAGSYYLLYQQSAISRDPVARVRDWLLSVDGQCKSGDTSRTVSSGSESG
jgi:LysR family glycine cleavage system transcriptional activator